MLAYLEDDEKCVELTKLTYNQILTLTGVKGVLTDEILSHKDTEINVRLVFDAIIVTIVIKKGVKPKQYNVFELSVIINLGKREIVNDLFEVAEESQGSGNATKWVKSQVENARIYNFHKLILEAAAAPYVGYLIWAKYGYVMCDEDQITMFRELMKQNNRDDEDLYALQCSETGPIIWKESGFSWQGHFILDSSSICSKRLEKKCFGKELAL